MPRPILDKEAREVFENLRQSQYFLPGYEKEKLSILDKLLGIRKKLRNFAAAVDVKEYQINGFLMECCAEFSGQIPRNTPRAEEFSRMIIAYLEGEKLYAPDYVWMNIRGRRIGIIGLGEVKSHPRVVFRKPFQTLLQRQNIEKMVQSGLMSRLLKTKAKIVYERETVNYLIVPRLDTNRFFHLPHTMPLGWEIREIEFSFPEIMFLKPLLLAAPKPVVSLYPKHLYEPFVNGITERMDTIVGRIFHNVPSIKKASTRSAILAWNMMEKSIPITQDTVDMVLAWSRELEQKNIYIPLLVADGPQMTAPVSGDEKSALALKEKFKQIPEIDSLIPAFLNRIREIKSTLSSLIVTPVLLHKKDVDLLTII